MIALPNDNTGDLKEMRARAIASTSSEHEKDYFRRFVLPPPGLPHFPLLENGGGQEGAEHCQPHTYAKR
jgi:hypothetical protein